MKKIASAFFVSLFIISLAVSVIWCCGVGIWDTVKFDGGEAKIIAHRGLSGLEIENTEEAFIAAGERSYYGIEADVRKTADGKFIICHDGDLERLCGVDIEVEKTDFDELMEIPLCNKWWRADDGSARLSTLDGYIEICKKYEKRAILELKSEFSSEEIGGIIDIIDSLDYLDSVTFISFDYDNLLHVRSFLPEQPVQYLFSEFDGETIERLKRDRIDAAVNHVNLTRRLVEEMHTAGLKVNCWTVDLRITAIILAEMGVDYITTNILENK